MSIFVADSVGRTTSGQNEVVNASISFAIDKIRFDYIDREDQEHVKFLDSPSVDYLVDEVNWALELGLVDRKWRNVFSTKIFQIILDFWLPIKP